MRHGLLSSYDAHPHARSEDLQHTCLDNNSNMALSASPSGSPMPGFQALSLLLTPNDSRSGASSSNHLENGAGFTDDSTTLKRLSSLLRLLLRDRRLRAMPPRSQVPLPHPRRVLRVRSHWKGVRKGTRRKGMAFPGIIQQFLLQLLERSQRTANRNQLQNASPKVLNPRPLRVSRVQHI